MIYTPTPERANLLAKLPGDGSKAPIVLLHHMDVVPANKGTWACDPFEGTLTDDQVWGRGAIDDKGLGIMQMLAFCLLRDKGVTVKRDVLLLAVSDEEAGGEFGAGWMVENHWPDIECEYLWDEGGTGTVGIMGDNPVFAVSVAEKRRMTVELTVSGTGGHGSFTVESPLNQMVTAIHRLQASKMPVQFGEVTKAFLRNVSKTQRFPASWLVRNADKPLVKSLMANKLAASPAIDAMLRDTITVTAIQSGDGSNVTPDSAHAILDVRLLPSTDELEFLRLLRVLLGDESIVIKTTSEPTAIVEPSDMNSEFFTSLTRVIHRAVSNSIVTPIQTPVATDSRFFRAKGVQAYGLLPAILTQNDLNTIHGTNEKISIDNLALGTRIIYETLVELCV
jgi:acetylornithine deacetylase/succinyl-diaminopimelate desuccinylase-like protein